jgi:Transposase DDE domain
MPPEPTGNPTLTDEMVRSAAVERLRPLVAGIGGGYRVNPEMVLDVLVYAAADGKSLHSACASLGTVADDTTLRDYLNAAFPASSVKELDARVNKLLLADLPEVLLRVRQDIAIDFHDVPFYGRVSDLAGWVCRGKAREGTTHFVRIATAYVMRDGLRLNVAVSFVRPTHSTDDILSTMLVRLRRAGLRIRCLWLDRGFASVAVVRRLEALRLPAVIACPIRGKAGGTRALCRGRCTYSTSYTLNSPSHGSWRVRMAVVYSYTQRRRDPRRARWFLYILVGCHLPPHQVHSQYRRRFGIETSYRCLGQVRPRTSSRNPALRFLFSAIGLVLVNLWTLLRFRLCQQILPRRGFRRAPVLREDRSRFRLARFKDFLRHAIELRRGLRACIILTPLEPCFGNH